jgi:hypothetical protein
MDTLLDRSATLLSANAAITKPAIGKLRARQGQGMALATDPEMNYVPFMFFPKRVPCWKSS